MSKVGIQPNQFSLDTALDIAKQFDYNLEIVAFARSEILDFGWEELLEEYKTKLRGFEGIISVHGIITDILVHSTDKKIQEISKNRVYHCLEISKALGAQFVVFHSNFNPIIRFERYYRNWLETHTVFWSEIINKYDFIVLLENMWEPNPEIFRVLLDEVNSPRIKICLDTGHANIYSEVPIKDWIHYLNSDVPYIHVNDNLGYIDDHFAVGDGNIDWKAFSDSIEEANINPQIVFEGVTLEKTMKSIDYFRKEKIYPFQVSK